MLHEASETNDLVALKTPLTSCSMRPVALLLVPLLWAIITAWQCVLTDVQMFLYNFFFYSFNSLTSSGIVHVDKSVSSLMYKYLSTTNGKSLWLQTDVFSAMFLSTPPIDI